MLGRGTKIHSIRCLATEAISSSQAEVEFCQKEYEQKQVVEEEDGKQEDVEEQVKINNSSGRNGK